ncbi:MULTISPECIES: type II toxin-antitoxin system RelE/ParE family toxin [unclassified Fusibacter]|uniref:type II toxin-antitoxin system RelE/ParE family toxin n=1 Tax=unclassified Fusibacter TaxID=2624464 RepID=UPI001012A594|nr:MULTISPECIES: type II toxin-antitoxin system RelE/ParE family toxin [unclassified Fusibacter]MCK8058430.1 type II toxin-antitoxin system RelE/ParE family toxin [Fusibacter sp. A2]NPE22802.1 type II toxin-antitoxin system RelE/ParE family toxin [Fusibacter sp. A1]RXV60357.1 addiction module toxin RelE [Fusibacter sp. A1]
MTPEFDKEWTRLCLSDHELRQLQEEILANPQIGKVISGTGGLRKMRFSTTEGKSGGARVLYVDIVIAERVYLITTYAKGNKENISDKDKLLIKKMIEKIKHNEN